MTTEAPIRRSSRRVKKRLFNVGDIVEINEVSLLGRERDRREKLS